MSDVAEGELAAVPTVEFMQDCPHCGKDGRVTVTPIELVEYLDPVDVAEFLRQVDQEADDWELTEELAEYFITLLGAHEKLEEQP